MIPQASASVTVASNGRRYSSRSGASATRTSTVPRSTSVSLATKCLTVTATSWACTART